MHSELPSAGNESGKRNQEGLVIEELRNGLASWKAPAVLSALNKLMRCRELRREAGAAGVLVLESHHGSRRVLIKAVELIGAHAELNARAVDALIGAAQSMDPLVSDKAVAVIATAGRLALRAQPVIERLVRTRPTYAVLAAVETLGTAAASCSTQLRDLSLKTSSDPAYRARAVEALSVIAPCSAELDEALAAALSSGKTRLVSAALCVLAAEKRMTSEQVAAAEKFVEAWAVAGRRDAVNYVFRASGYGCTQAESLAEKARCANTEFQLVALEFFADLLEPVPAAADVAASLLDSTSDVILSAAIDVLLVHRGAYYGADLTPKLFALLGSHDDNVRLGAVSALQAFGVS